MVKQPKTDGAEAGGSQKTRSEARQERLEAALRDNLKRRKQQTRARNANKADATDAASKMPASRPVSRDD